MAREGKSQRGRVIPRRSVLELLAVPALVGLAEHPVSAQDQRRTRRRAMDKQWVFVGTNTGEKSKGIYRFQFDPRTGACGPVELAAETANPTFLNLHPSGRFLYAVNAIGEFQGEKTGAVSAFAVDRRSGNLTLLNQQPSAGPGPCHVVVDARGRNALVANYGGGSVACLPIQADGRLSAPSSSHQHRGSSVNQSRQQGPHAHSINLDQANRFAFAADLGLDQVLVYRFDGDRGVLTPNDPAYATVKPGAGPRHFDFHPSGRFAYVINELDSTVTAFRYDAGRGVLTEIQAITSLPEGFQRENYPARVHPDGRFLYGSNRGHDSLAIYRIDQESGRLTAVGHQASGGEWPRNFNFDPSGNWVILGNGNSDNVLVFRMDRDQGTLSQVGKAFAAPAPICFRFLAVEA